MEQNKTTFIQFIQTAISMDADRAKKIVDSFHPTTIKKGAFLLKENTISDDYLFLANGLMRGFVHDLDGNEITTDIFTPNNVVFEVTSFFNRVKSPSNIQAITDCVGFRASYQELNNLFHSKPEFRDFGRAILVKEFIASKKRNYAMINQTAEQRYQNLLSTKPEIFKSVPLKYIASYIGVTDSTLSRIRKKTE